MRFRPVLSIINVHLQRHYEVDRSLHFSLNNVFDRLKLTRWELDQQLVMNLKNHPCFQPPLLEFLKYVYHGYLNNVRRRSLNGRIDRKPLSQLPHRCTFVVDLRDSAFPSEQGRYVPFIPRFFEAFLDLVLDPGMSPEI